MLLVYTHKITNRLRYTFKQIFEEILGLPLRFTTDKEEFVAYIGTKLSYTFEPVEDELFFHARDLLFEKRLRNVELNPKFYDDILGFFPVSKHSTMPFDPFAASFYLLSRYEEYLPFAPDDHGRFSMSQSVLNKPDWLMKPWVDIWAYHLRDILLKRYPNAVFKDREFKFLSTIDVDQAYAYRHKGFLRSVGTFSKQLLQGNFKEILHQFKVLIAGRQDPFNTFDELLAWHESRGLDLQFFFLVGDYGVYDQSIAYTHPAFRLLVKSVHDYVPIGLHPSYRASHSSAKIKGEKKRLEQMVHREVTDSRQHFLRIQFPDTPRMLLDLDIERDYTLAYAEHPGFRAGTCTPFPFYDLQFEVPTKLQMVPTSVMDVSMRYYLGLEPNQAVEMIKKVMDEVKAVDGQFVSLWHNNSVSDFAEWEGWQKVFLQQLDLVK